MIVMYYTRSRIKGRGRRDWGRSIIYWLCTRVLIQTYSQQADDLPVLWEKDSDFYESSIEYYENNPQGGLVIYKRTGDCESEVEMEHGTKGAWED